MPRIPRGLIDGFIYHVINRGNGRQEVFHKEQDYEAFINLMEEAKGRHPVKILAYCLIPNHFHMVLKPEKAEDLSKFMQWSMTSHVRRYHRHYGTDRKSTRLNSSHGSISYAVFCLKKKDTRH